jgi:hypothetical protein
MKYILAFTLAMTVFAQAQTPMPKTVRVYNNSNGELIGTATLWDRTFTFRDSKGELIGTLTIEADGSRTFRDPSGNIIDTLSIADPGK